MHTANLKHSQFLGSSSSTNRAGYARKKARLEKSTCPLVFISVAGYRACEKLDDSQCKLTFFP